MTAASYYNKIAESTLNDYDYTGGKKDNGRGPEAGTGTLQGQEGLQTTDTRDDSRGTEGSGSRDEDGTAKPAAPDNNTAAAEPRQSEGVSDEQAEGNIAAQEAERDNTVQRTVSSGLREQPAGEAPRSGDGVDIVVLGNGLSPEQLGDYEKGSRAEQEAVGNQIIENAKQNGVFIERSSLNNYGQRVQQPSGESVVYIDEPDNHTPHSKATFCTLQYRNRSYNDTRISLLVLQMVSPHDRQMRRYGKSHFQSSALLFYTVVSRHVCYRGH